MSNTILNFDQVIYDEYISFVDVDNLPLSAYNVFNHFFTKFRDVSAMEDKIPANLRDCKKKLCKSIDVLYKIYNYYSKIVILDGKNADNIMRHMGVVNHIIKHEIFKLSENYKINAKAYEKDEFWKTNIYNEYIKQKQHNQIAIDVLFNTNLVCRDVSNCVYQYM